MAFLNKIARALGFGGEEELDYDQYLNSASENVSAQLPTEGRTSTEPPALPSADTSAVIEIDAEHINLIFSRVVATFNQALPTFLAESVDGEKQKQLLYQGLDESLKDYLKLVQRQAHEKCQTDWAIEREKLQADADELRRHAAELEEKKSQLKDRQLSADRQKRALSERVKDLEEQVMRLEAEKEQLDIENKCMLNKAKAAAVLEAQLEDLQAEKQKNTDNNDAAAARSEINDAMLSEFKKQAAEATQALKATKEQYANLEEQLKQQEAQIEDLKQAADAKEALLVTKEEELQAKIAELAAKDEQLAAKDEQLTAKDEQITAKEAELVAKEAEIAEKDAELEDAISQEELEVLMGQVEKFEEVRAKMDAHIEKLRESLRKAQEENKSLRESIKYHLEDKMRLEQTLQAMQNEGNEAEQPSEAVAEAVAAPKKKTVPKAKRRSAMEAVDDIISGDDWLVSVPDEESPMRAKESTEPFGYQAPQRKRTVENEAQLSLFDL